MSDQPVEIVRQQMDGMIAAAHGLGATLSDPFMTLGFLALPVIPDLKLTDRGLVDVTRFEVVPLFV
jgi:adenine deaminase